MQLAHSPIYALECHLVFQTIIQASPKLIWDSSIPQDERGDPWRCEHKGSQRIHPTSSRTFFSQQDDEILSLCHCHPIQDKLPQGDLHIFPPINIVEGCQDMG